MIYLLLLCSCLGHQSGLRGSIRRSLHRRSCRRRRRAPRRFSRCPSSADFGVGREARALVLGRAGCACRRDNSVGSGRRSVDLRESRVGCSWRYLLGGHGLPVVLTAFGNGCVCGWLGGARGYPRELAQIPRGRCRGQRVTTMPQSVRNVDPRVTDSQNAATGAERVAGIGPAPQSWKDRTLPLRHTRERTQF